MPLGREPSFRDMNGLEYLPDHVLRSAEPDAFAGLDQRALDQDRVRHHRVEHLVVADVGRVRPSSRRAAPWRASLRAARSRRVRRGASVPRGSADS